MVVEERHFNENYKVLLLSQKIIFSKIKNMFSFVNHGWQSHGCSFHYSIHFGFLKLKERKTTESHEASGGQCGPSWGLNSQVSHLVPMKSRRVPILGISCACGCHSTSQIQHVGPSLTDLGENIWEDQAASRRLGGNRAGGPAGMRHPAWGSARRGPSVGLCSPVCPCFAPPCHLLTQLPYIHFLQEAFPDPQSGIQGPSLPRQYSVHSASSVFSVLFVCIFQEVYWVSSEKKGQWVLCIP